MGHAGVQPPAAADDGRLDFGLCASNQSTETVDSLNAEDVRARQDTAGGDLSGPARHGSEPERGRGGGDPGCAIRACEVAQRVDAAAAEAALDFAERDEDLARVQAEGLVDMLDGQVGREVGGDGAPTGCNDDLILVSRAGDSGYKLWWHTFEPEA